MTAWSRIRTLELPECDLKGQDVLAGVLAQCPALAHLDLGANHNFGAPGAERLAGVLGQCRELVYLDLCDNNVGPDGAGNLARVLAQCTALTDLDLHGNWIGAAGADRLSGVLPQVRSPCLPQSRRSPCLPQSSTLERATNCETTSTASCHIMAQLQGAKFATHHPLQPLAS